MEIKTCKEIWEMEFENLEEEKLSEKKWVALDDLEEEMKKLLPRFPEEYSTVKEFLWDLFTEKVTKNERKRNKGTYGSH